MRIPWSRRSTRAASTHFVKVRGDNARPNGRTRYWYALPPKANLRNWHWDLSWQTSPRIWSVTRFVSKLTFWTWAAWRIRSELEDPKWDATLHPSLELWNTGCKTRFPCWSEVHILWPLSLTELLFPVPLPDPAGGPPWWKTPHIFYNLQDPMRYIWQKFPRCQNSTRGTSLSRLVSGFICSCAVRTTFWNGKPTGSVWTDHSETLLGGGGHPKGHYVSGWTLRYALARDRCALRHTKWQGWQTGPWGHRRETGTVKWGVNRSTSRGKSSLAWALGCQDHFPQPSRINNGPQIRFTLWRLRFSVFTVFPVFMWGSTISNALLLCGTWEELDLDVWGCSRSAAPEIWIQRGRSFWNAAACLADSWNLSTTKFTLLLKDRGQREK